MKKSNNPAIIISSLCLVVILMTFNHCVVQTKVNKKKATTTDSSSSSTIGEISGDFTDTAEPEPDPGGDTTESTSEVVNEEVKMGVKNFEEIYLTMSVLTGVPHTVGAIKNTYNDIKVLLPTDNDIKTFVSVNQVSILKLAGEYCHELVRVSGYRSMIWPSVNFGESSSTAFSDAKRDYIIDQVMQKFWNVPSDEMYLYNIERNEFNLLMDELLAGATANSTTTQMTIKAVCSAALASAHVILL